MPKPFAILVSAVGLLIIFCSLPVNANTKQLKSANCVACHQEQTADWEKSDHAMAMALPTQNKVLANFDNQSAKHYTEQALFFKSEGVYKATITDTKSGTSETFDIKYTFGHYPLQQYLVETKTGTFQVLPFAWDSRPAQVGGQRWYHNYEDLELDSADRLHWRQPLQNWNGMCADCHSDELTRNYNEQTNSFDTTYTGINVGCVSCHGVMDGHLLDTQNGESKQSPSSGHTLHGQWRLLENADTALWDGPERNNEFMQTCYACHSLRSPLTDGFTAEKSFLDQFTPSFITPPLYFADGQIKEEVYVYGSFLQSKMYQQGVNCLDCHDKHTMKVKAQGNALCLQCHKASSFDTPKHHKHEAFSTGAQCVNCHMPDTTYMGVDDRRDHSFKIPRPDLSIQFSTPNACIDCHQEKDNKWAAKALKEWFGEPEKQSKNKQNLTILRHGQRLAINDHIAIVNDKTLPEIDRASAISLLAQSAQSIPPDTFSTWLRSAESLIRLAATQESIMLPPRQRAALVGPLLDDPLKSVRSAAAQVLIGIELNKQNLRLFTKALNELSIANETSAWRGEGRVNQGNVAMQTFDPIGAELAFKGATKIDPYFPAGYINLADLYRAKQREDMVATVLSKGMENLPQSADIAYSYGLHMVRIKKIAKAIDYFVQAMELDPSNPQFAYTYVLAMDGNNQSLEALTMLKALILRYEDKVSLIELGVYLAQKNGKREDIAWFSRLQN